MSSPGASRALADGEEVLVDGDAGKVYRMGAPLVGQAWDEGAGA